MSRNIDLKVLKEENIAQEKLRGELCSHFKPKDAVALSTCSNCLAYNSTECIDYINSQRIPRKETKKLRGELCPHYVPKDAVDRPICCNCANISTNECKTYISEQTGRRLATRGIITKKMQKELRKRKKMKGLGAYGLKELYERARELKKQDKNVFGDVNFYHVGKEELIKLIEKGEKKLKEKPQEPEEKVTPKKSKLEEMSLKELKEMCREAKKKNKNVFGDINFWRESKEKLVALLKKAQK